MHLADFLKMGAGAVRTYQSVGKSHQLCLDRMEPRTKWLAASVTPNTASKAKIRSSPGTYSGTFTLPKMSSSNVYTPIILEGPLNFPITAGTRVDFSGRVHVPFYSMDGWFGTAYLASPPNPPNTIDPAHAWSSDGFWGQYYIVGSVDGVTQFRQRISANSFWFVTANDPPAGAWSFQLVTYASEADYSADSNRVNVGNPWTEAEHAGDIRNYYDFFYVEQDPQFTNVVVNHAEITGTLADYDSELGFTYQILVTTETDVEYCHHLEPVTSAGDFTLSMSHDPVGSGDIKLRLMKCQNGCSIEQIGQVWTQSADGMDNVYPDLRIELRRIGSTVPFFPTSYVPASKALTWSFELTGDTLPRITFVNVNTKQIYSEYTMPSGLMRSFIVPSDRAGQNTTSVYYDGFQDTCFLYDQAVALIGLLQIGDIASCKRLVETLLLCQNEDGSFSFSSNQSAVDHVPDFIRNGAVAWVCYALLIADRAEYRSNWTTRTDVAAKSCIDYLLTYVNTIGLIKGGKGQYVDNVLDPDYIIPWWSTEHNIDFWWCLDEADSLYGSDGVDYRSYADGIKSSLRSYGWDSEDGIFWQGGGHDGDDTVNDGSHALDTHTWGGILLAKWGYTTDAQNSLARALEKYYVVDTDTGIAGFTTFIEEDGYPSDTVEAVWFEGSFGGISLMRDLDPLLAQGFMQRLTLGQQTDGTYFYALKEDTVNDIHPWPALIGSAWNLVAYSGLGTPHPIRLLWRVN